MIKTLVMLLSVLVWRAAAGPIDGLAAGHWYQVPNSHLANVDPCPAHNCSYSAVEGISGIMDDWCGAAYDTDREQLIVWGGGHGGYAGNEVYTFGPMTSNTPSWTRRTDPSTPDQDCNAVYPDGRPASTHTYNTLVYAPNVQRFFSMGMGSNYPCGSENRQIWSLNMADYTWDPMSANPNMGIGGWQGGWAAYDEKTGYIWCRPANNWNLRVYDPETRSFVAGSFPDSQILKMEMTSAVDPVRHIMVGIGGYGGGQPTVCWDLENRGKGFKPATTGDKTAENGDSRGFQFHPPSGLFVAWFGGANVYTLKPPANLRTEPWVWTRVTPSAGNTVVPPSENSTGTYGRFQYCPGPDVFMCVNAVDQDVYVYRLDYTPASVTAPGPSAAAAGGITVSPNPFKSQAIITIDKKFRVPSFELDIFDITGKQLETWNSELETRNSFTWNAAGLPAGVYLLRVQAGRQTFVKRLFVQR